MKTLIYLPFLWISTFVYSQAYEPLDTTDYKKRIEFILELKEANTIAKKNLKNEFKGKIRKELENSYDHVFQNFSKDVLKKKIVFNDSFNNYLQGLLSEISTNNSNFLTATKIHTSKHNSPNAFCFLNGNIIVNMGLFKYLENEAQLAAVIAHEIAHRILEHPKKNIIYHIKEGNSDAKKKELKEIKRAKYNQYGKAFESLKKSLFANLKTHRKYEIQADSLGFLLFKNTKYPKQEFLKALEIFAKLDSLPEISLTKKTYKKYFNFKGLPFNEKWLNKEEFNTYRYDHYKEKIGSDSLKTHPEIIDRLNYIKKLTDSPSVEKKNSYNNEKFLSLQKIAINEDITNLFHLEKYGLSIYLTLYKLEKNGGSTYYFKNLAKNFDELYKAKKKYRLNKYIDQIIPNVQDDSYQQFLSFIWNLNLSDIQKISQYYSNL